MRAFAISLLLLASCTHLRPNPPKPLDDVPTPPPLELSSVMLPISVPLETLRKQVDDGIPKRFMAWHAWTRGNHWCARYKVERQPVALDVAGSSMRVTVPGHIWVKGCYSFNNRACVPCGSCDTALSVPVSTTLTVHPDWRIGAELKNGGIALNRCGITIANINISGHIERAANPALDRALDAVNGMLAESLNFRSKGERLWARAHEPLRVTDDLWLVLNPRGVRVSPISKVGSDMSVAVGIVAEPRLVAGARPEVAPAPPLPPLEIVAPTDAFHVALGGSLDYETASKRLAKQLVGKRYPFAVRRPRFWFFGPLDSHTVWVKVTGARLYGSGASAIVELTVDEAVAGTLYFVGRPEYDVATETLRVVDLDYSLETRNLLVNAAEWLLHGTLQKTISASARWPLTQPLSLAREKIGAALNQRYGDVTLRGELAALRVLTVSADPRGFHVQAVADGRVSASMP